MEWILEKHRFENFKHKFLNYKRVCELVILLFFILLYLLLKYSTVPQVDLEFSRNFKEIDWPRYKEDFTKKIKKHEIPKPGPPPDVESVQATADWAEVVNADFIKTDISTLLNQLPNKSLVDVPKKQISKDLPKPMKLEQVEQNISINSDEYLQDDINKLMPQVRIDPKEIGQSVSVNDIEINQSNIGENQINPTRKPSTLAADKLIPDAGIIEIPLLSDDEVKDKPDISVIKDQLMLWMQKHPAEFNEVTKGFLNFNKNNLMSKDVFRHKDRVFELYLLYKKNVREIVICLLEGDQSIKLIDSGFKKQSNYLRLGDVVRKSDNTIFSFSTSQRPASEEASINFYQIFMSWWEKASKEI